jgi:hypothetical protein
MLQIWWFKVCFVVEQWYDNTGCVGLNEKKNEIVQVETDVVVFCCDVCWRMENLVYISKKKGGLK